jgi:PAS domain-containing protein
VTHLIWLHRGVTAQIEREEKMAALIAEKEERFSAYVENANEAIWRIDFEPPIPLDAPESRQVQMIFDNGVFSEANDAVARTYGLTRGKEAIDRPLRKFMEQSDPKNVEKTSSFGRKVADSRLKLTPREIEVCNMVKNGLTSKEIAGLLNIALHTVEKHRRIINSSMPGSVRPRTSDGTSIPWGASARAIIP